MSTTTITLSTSSPEGFQVIEGFTAHKSSRHCELQWGTDASGNEWFIDWASGVMMTETDSVSTQMPPVFWYVTRYEALYEYQHELHIEEATGSEIRWFYNDGISDTWGYILHGPSPS